MMTQEITPSELHDHYMSPSYFPPEVVQIARDWYESTAEQRRTYVRDEGPSPLPELVESLAQQGVTEPVEVMELIIIASGKWYPEQKEK